MNAERLHAVVLALRQESNERDVVKKMENLVNSLQAVGLTLLLLCIVGTASDRLDYEHLKSVVRIETAPTTAGLPEGGCGFLVGTDPANGGRLFLVTNKHMVGDWNAADGDIHNPYPWIDVFFYRTVTDASERGYRATRINLVDHSGQIDASRVRLYQAPRVDVVAIDVTDKVKDPSEQIAWISYDRSYLIPFDRIESWQTGIGDEVIALGYPYNIRFLRNNYPVAKVGYVASAPGEELSLPINTNNRRGVMVPLILEGKYLLVDGLITNGNSGGPVLLVGGDKNAPQPTDQAVGVLNSGYS